jgi:hypothetical protein
MQVACKSNDPPVGIPPLPDTWPVDASVGINPVPDAPPTLDARASGDSGADAARPDSGLARTLRFDFATGTQGFTSGHSDWSDLDMGDLMVTPGNPMPAPLAGNGLRVASINRSDDQWVFIARELNATDGITASTSYDVVLRARIATQLQAGCPGVGGSAEAVTLKGGAVGRAPAVARDSAGRTEFNLQKGNQTELGPDAVLLGSGTVVGTGTRCEAPVETNPGELITRVGAPMRVQSDASGRLWVYIGTDSGYETGFTIWYRDVEVVLTPVR